MGAEEATKRLRIHAQRLAELISRRGFASVEVSYFHVRTLRLDRTGLSCVDVLVTI